MEHVEEVDHAVTTFNQVLSPTEFSEYCMPCSDSPSIITVDESFQSMYSDEVYESNDEFEVVHSSNAFDNDFSTIDRSEIELVDIGVCGSWETDSFDSTHVHFEKKDQEEEEDEFPFGTLPDVDSTSSVSSNDDVSSSIDSTSSPSVSSCTSDSIDSKEVTDYKSEMTQEIEIKASNFSALMNHWKAKEREWKERRVK